MEESVAKVRDSLLRQVLEINKYLGSNKQFKKIYQSLYLALLALLQLLAAHPALTLAKDNVKAIVGILSLT